jgi:UDP-N-acetylmuramoyl-tripeptide--D-alanyl-D-alanine ligase
MQMTRSRTFDAAFLAAATGGTPVGEPWGERVETDSRVDLTGALFVALSGERFDGHDFVEEALRKGAGGAVVGTKWRQDHRAVPGDLLVVSETLAALQDLARAHRRRHPVPLAAITGSNGKTTTKELLALALAPLGPVLKTEGNRNNHIGLPLTLLALDESHRAAVVEIGLNHPGELRLLSAIARPQVGVITNVAASHLQGLGTVDGVAEAKAEIAESLDESGILVVPEDSEPLSRALAGWRGRRRTFGLSARADVHPRRVNDHGAAGMEIELADGTVVRVPLLGEHAARNVLAALAAAEVLGVAPAQAAQRMGEVRPTAGRLAPVVAGGVVVLDDTYNSNPGSLAASLRVLRTLAPAARRWAVLGDMLELGSDAAPLHRRAGALAAFLDGLVTVGPLARELGRGAIAAGLDPGRVHEAPSGEAAGALAARHLRPGDVVLVKASRGLHLETAVASLRRGLGEEV